MSTNGQGPTPMALGPFHFRALGFGFTDTSEDLQTPWAEIEVADRMDAAQWTGPKSEAFQIKGALFPEEYGGQDTLNALKRAAKAGQALMLVTYAGDVHGLHRVESIAAENSHIRSDGLARKKTYTIALKRLGDG